MVPLQTVTHKYAESKKKKKLVHTHKLLTAIDTKVHIQRITDSSATTAHPISTPTAGDSL